MWYYTYIIYYIFPHFLFPFAIDLSKKFRFFSHDMGCNRALHTKIKLFRLCHFEDQMISIPFRIEIQSKELSELVVDSSGSQFFTRLDSEEQWNRQNSAINSQRKIRVGVKEPNGRGRGLSPMLLWCEEFVYTKIV